MNENVKDKITKSKKVKKGKIMTDIEDSTKVVDIKPNL